MEDRRHERIEACHKCKRYLIGMDMRAQVEETSTEVAEIGLMHLDAIAQEKGFLPFVQPLNLATRPSRRRRCVCKEDPGMSRFCDAIRGFMLLCGWL